MKIGLNTYSFRKELDNEKSMNLEDVWKIAKNLKYVEGIELLDRHIPGWSDGDIKSGIKEVAEQLESLNLKLYGLGPHLHMYKGNNVKREQEANEYKKWIDFAADNGIPMIRSQVGGVLKLLGIKMVNKGVKTVKNLLDRVIPYAEERNVQIGLETHWQFSSDPQFLDEISQIYKDSPAFGIIFDWGNYKTNEDRFKALEIAARPYNHCYNHVKFYHFGENFQVQNSIEDERHYYDTFKIVNTFKNNGFKNYFSIEFEGKQPALEGVYKSVNGLKFAMTNGEHKIDPEFDWDSLKG